MTTTELSAPHGNVTDLETFRTKCANFLDQHATGISVAETNDPRHESTHHECVAFQQAAAAAGLAGLTYPVEYGGQGLTDAHQQIWREEASKHPLMTRTLSISQGMCLPMLHEYGTDAQRAVYQADLISASQVWCQMFSEPGAGSDVASLQMSAVRDGDEWIINGQKVWTTLAHVADRGIVIARTDSEQPKHRGISMFIIDMSAPGVEIRPIHQIDGGMRFNEVYLTDVRVPVDHQIGERQPRLAAGNGDAHVRTGGDRHRPGGRRPTCPHRQADSGGKETCSARLTGPTPGAHEAVQRRGVSEPDGYADPSRGPSGQNPWAWWVARKTRWCQHRRDLPRPVVVDHRSGSCRW